jgi:hypothetical protein
MVLRAPNHRLSCRFERQFKQAVTEAKTWPDASSFPSISRPGRSPIRGWQRPSSDCSPNPLSRPIASSSRSPKAPWFRGFMMPRPCSSHCAMSGCASHSTMSAPAIQASTICASSISTSSRLTLVRDEDALHTRRGQDREDDEPRPRTGHHGRGHRDHASSRSLTKLDCDTGQGGLFGVPMPAATTATAVAEHAGKGSRRRRA